MHNLIHQVRPKDPRECESYYTGIPQGQTFCKPCWHFVRINNKPVPLMRVVRRGDDRDA